MNEADWKKYNSKRVEIWDKASKSTKSVRDTIWEIYQKGFMDGVNDQAERYKDSAYRQKHDSELLDKVAERIKNGCICTDYSCGIPFNKDCENCNNNMIDFTNVMEIIEEMKAEVSE